MTLRANKQRQNLDRLAANRPRSMGRIKMEVVLVLKEREGRKVGEEELQLVKILQGATMRKTDGCRLTRQSRAQLQTRIELMAQVAVTLTTLPRMGANNQQESAVGQAGTWPG